MKRHGKMILTMERASMDEDEDARNLAYGRRRPIAARLEEVERLRKLFHGDDDETRLAIPRSELRLRRRRLR